MDDFWYLSESVNVGDRVHFLMALTAMYGSISLLLLGNWLCRRRRATRSQVQEPETKAESPLVKEISVKEEIVVSEGENDSGEESSDNTGDDSSDEDYLDEGEETEDDS